MEPHDRTAFAKAMTGVAEIHGRKLSTEQFALYWETLKSYALTDVIGAVQRHMADPDVGQFMPKPADIIRQIDGSGDSQAMRAWTKAITAVRRVSTYATVVFDDWRIHAVVNDMGGWIALGTISDDELPFKAREFEKRYRGYRTDVPYPAKLIGREEAHNTSMGVPPPAPVLIGDQRMAALTHECGSDGSQLLQIGTLTQAALANLRPNQDDAA